MGNSDTPRLERINRDGYLFQLRIEELIDSIQPKTMSRSGPWQKILSEYRWMDPANGREEFADLILSRSDRQRLIVECKRFGSNVEGEWLFYVTEPKPHDPETFVLSARHISTSTEDTSSAWANVNASLDTYVSSFCTWKGEKTNDDKSRSLEKIAGTITRACEVIGTREKQIEMRGSAKEVFYIPVIFTTAKLYACRFNRNDIDLNTGTLSSDFLSSAQIPEWEGLNANEVVFEKVNVIRFTKSLSTTLQIGSVGQSLESIHRASQRTVMVVSVDGLVDFLQRFEIKSISN